MKIITFRAVGAVDYADGLNVRYMTDQFSVGGVSVVFECGHHTRGTACPSIYETREDGATYGNARRMERAGYWKRYAHGWQVVVDNLPEYSKSGIVEALKTIYPELGDFKPVFIN